MSNADSVQCSLTNNDSETTLNTEMKQLELFERPSDVIGLCENPTPESTASPQSERESPTSVSELSEEVANQEILLNLSGKSLQSCSLNSHRLEMSNTEASHLSVIINDTVLESEMEKLKLMMKRSSGIFPAENPPQPKHACPTSAVDDIAGELYELVKNLSSKKSESFQNELSCSILTISSKATTMENDLQTEDTRSSLNSTDIYEDISISDSSEDSGPKNVDYNNDTRFCEQSAIGMYIIKIIKNFFLQ